MAEAKSHHKEPVGPLVRENTTAAIWPAPDKRSLPRGYLLLNNNPHDQGPEARKPVSMPGACGWRRLHAQVVDGAR